MTYKIGNVKDDIFREVFNHKSKTQSKIEKKIINKYCLDLDIGTYLADMVEEGLLIKKKMERKYYLKQQNGVNLKWGIALSILRDSAMKS